MTRKKLQDLSRRERQIMDVIYRLGEATAAEVRDNIPDPPSMNAVRRLISILEEKGLLNHKWEGPRHLYSPVIKKDEARRSAVDHLKKTFFDGSVARTMAGLLSDSDSDLSDEELEALAKLIDQARKQNR